MDTGIRWIANKFGHEKGVFILGSQCCARVVHHPGRTAFKVANAWSDISGLAFKSRQVHFFIHPNFVSIVSRIPVFSVLPVASPTCVRAVYNIYQPFFFTWMIPVVVFADDISIFIKYKLVRIPKTCCKHFEVASVGI